MPIIVNKIEITDDEVHAEMQYHPASDIEEARHLAAQTLVIKQLLLQEASQLNIGGKDDESLIDGLIGQEISTPEADAETCRRYYEQHGRQFLDKKSGKILQFPLVENHIRDYLQDKALRAALSSYIVRLASNANIAGFELKTA